MNSNERRIFKEMVSKAMFEQDLENMKEAYEYEIMKLKRRRTGYFGWP